MRANIATRRCRKARPGSVPKGAAASGGESALVLLEVEEVDTRGRVYREIALVARHELLHHGRRIA